MLSLQLFPRLLLLLTLMVRLSITSVQAESVLANHKDGSLEVPNDMFQPPKQALQGRRQQQSRKNPVCYICGAGMFVGAPDSTVVLSLGSQNSNYRSYPCGTLQELGFQGNIPIETCTPDLIDIVRGPCQCQGQQQQKGDGNNHNNSEPSPVPPVENNSYRYPFCSICGHGKSVENANASVPYTSLVQAIAGGLPSSLSFNSTSITCSELQLVGFEGYVSPNDCSNLYSTVVSPCECSTAYETNALTVLRSGVINIGIMLAFFMTVTVIWVIRVHISDCRHRNSNDNNTIHQNAMNSITSSLDDPEMHRKVLMLLFPEQPGQAQKEHQPRREKLQLKHGNNDNDHDETESIGQEQPKENEQPVYDPETKQCHPQRQQQLNDNEDDEESGTMNELTVCSICLEGIGLEDAVVDGIQCHHNFHRSCIFDWFTMEQQHHNDCPMCRQPMWDPEQYMAAAIKQQQQEEKEEAIKQQQQEKEEDEEEGNSSSSTTTSS